MPKVYPNKDAAPANLYGWPGHFLIPGYWDYCAFLDGSSMEP